MQMGFTYFFVSMIIENKLRALLKTLNRCSLAEQYSPSSVHPQAESALVKKENPIPKNDKLEFGGDKNKGK